ncbi:Phage tail fibers [Devosia sp. DBB001]|nr:Phage tail fibers [Devosia sp. DBB001]
MAKDKISDWDVTPANNLDVGNITLAENVMPPSAVNDAFRMMMSQIKAWFGSNLFALWDSADVSKKMAFDLSGITTLTTRTLKIPDANGTIALIDDPWALAPIGVPLPIATNLAGVATPPTNKGYRYIQLSASSAYNTGVLTSESVTGSAPLVVATAVINLAGSPLLGQTVNLINTERRFLRGGAVGTVETDTFQGHTHPQGAYSFNVDVANSGSPNRYSGNPNNAGIVTSDGANGTPRTANETRGKNIGVDYFMRIK